MLTLILDCDMLFMLGRSGKECPFFVPVSRMVGGVVLRAANPESNDCRGQSYLDSYDPALQCVPVCRAQKRSCTAAPPLRTIFRSPTQYDRFVRGDSPQEMTLGDSVNNRQGSFPFRFGI